MLESFDLATLLTYGTDTKHIPGIVDSLRHSNITASCDTHYDGGMLAGLGNI